MTNLPGNHALYAELAKARACVDGKTFAGAPELFKDIEGLKVRIGVCEQASRSGQKQHSEDR